MSARRRRIPVGRATAAVLAVTAYCAGWRATEPRAQERVAPKLAAAGTATSSEAPWVGVGGCAAAACHGGEVGQPRGEYTTWISRDPHARAYSVLFAESSLRMARQLAGGNAASAVPPHEDRRCIACHAPTGPASDRAPQIVGDGVGCEACHGGADTWAAKHHTINWKNLSPAEQSIKRKELGMADTRDVLVRAQQCVRCHVGAGDADVTHDLIAAGHPRLSFELGAFHDQLPKHWSGEAERRRDRGFEAKLWAVGQMTSAAAHFDLLAARAERKTGIEFANYDCYACHHELRAPSQRPAQPGDPGALRPLNWFVPDERIWKVFRDESAQSLVSLEPERTAAIARSLAASLRGWALEQHFRTWNQTDILDATVKVVAAPPENANWDQATQWYLALVALERARLDHFDSVSDEAAAQNQQVQAALEEIKSLLDFPRADGNRVFNSPRDFDPQAFTAAAQRLAKLIQARDVEERGAP